MKEACESAVNELSKLSVTVVCGVVERVPIAADQKL